MKRRRKPSPKPDVLPEVPAKLETTTEPWTMVRLKNPGNGHYEIVAEEDVLGGVRLEYLVKYGQPEGSPMDMVVRRVLSAMPYFDFSSGKVEGVIRSKNDIRMGISENATAPLFEYKPPKLADVQGSESLASRARKLRVLFAMLAEHRLGIVTMLERDDMHAFGRNNGIFAGATRKNK